MSVTSSRSLTESISSMRSPNTVPWPQPVVTVRFFILSASPLSGLRVVTATESVSQSTCTEAMSSIELREPLVAQITDGERLGRLAESHQA